MRTLMNILKNLFGNNTKISAEDIAIKDNNGEGITLDEYLNEMNDRTIYSTDEKVIGTWIDGKPLYRKVFTTTMPSTNNSWVNVVNLLQVDMITKLNGILVGADGRKIYIPNYESTEYHYSLSYQPSTNAIQVYGNGSISFGGRPLYVIIEYTKTTD